MPSSQFVLTQRLKKQFVAARKVLIPVTDESQDRLFAIAEQKAKRPFRLLLRLP